MYLVSKINKFYQGIRARERDAKTAYNIWANTYDEQPGNLMLDLDEKIVIRLLENIDLEEKCVIDIGCGTGRHWQKLYEKKPGQLVGYDVSEGMLKKLKQKYPHADTHLIAGDHFYKVPDACYDFLISTLTIAHITNIENQINEWCRILKYESDIIVTDFHPATLAKGGKRSFVQNNKSFVVKNHIYSLQRIEELFTMNGFICVRKLVIEIDETVKHYYEQQNALHVYDQFLGTPVIFGIHLKRNG